MAWNGFSALHIDQKAIYTQTLARGGAKLISLCDGRVYMRSKTFLVKSACMKVQKVVKYYKKHQKTTFLRHFELFTSNLQKCA